MDAKDGSGGVGGRLVLVLGATGYVGGRLVSRLVHNGYRVRCLVRSPDKITGLPWAADVDIVRGDLLDPPSVECAVRDVDAACYLVHAMGGPVPRPASPRSPLPGVAPPDSLPPRASWRSRGDGDFASADRAAAQTFVRAAAAAGVRRIVYLGGLGEVTEDTSQHLRSRAEVGEILSGGWVPTTVLRAAVIIGSGSASFEMLRHLVEKLPVMIVPRWVHTRVQPIAIRDVLRYLVGVLDDDTPDDHVYDIGGPDVLTYLEMMQTYARVAGLPRRLVVRVPLLTPSLSSHWVNLVTPVPFGVARPLVSSLTSEVVVRPGASIAAVVPGATLPYEDAVRLALARVRDREVETSWRDAEIAGRSPAEPYPGDPEWTGGTLLQEVHRVATRASPTQLFQAVTRIGGDRGWPTHRWAWQARGRLDRLMGGVGLRRGRRDPDRLRVGDALDFWRVEEVREPADGTAGSGVVRLRAEMRLPGRAWLEFRIQNDGAARSTLSQRALFAPRGLLGRAYWYALLPFHGPIFASMARRLARDAERLAHQ